MNYFYRDLKLSAEITFTDWYDYCCRYPIYVVAAAALFFIGLTTVIAGAS